MQIYSKIPTVGAVQNVSSKNLLSLFLSVSSNASFEKCCNFYPNNFKFCGVKKNPFFFLNVVFFGENFVWSPCFLSSVESISLDIPGKTSS